MEYRYPPLYKYIAFFIILFLFLRHYKQLTQDKYLIISILITLLVVLLDYMLIFGHPNILQTKESFDSDDLDDILDDDNTFFENKYEDRVMIEKPQQITRKSTQCKQCSSRTSSELPVLKPIIYNDDYLSEDDYPEYQMQNMMNLHNMQNIQMQHM